MGLFGGLGKGLDKALQDNSEKQERAEEMQRIMSGKPVKQQNDKEPKEIQKVSPTDQFGFMSALNPLMGGGVATAQQQKDFRILEQNLVDMCSK